jgi:hypothetical protein
LPKKLVVTPHPEKVQVVAGLGKSLLEAGELMVSLKAPLFILIGLLVAHVAGGFVVTVPAEAVTTLGLAPVARPVDPKALHSVKSELDVPHQLMTMLDGMAKRGRIQIRRAG